MERKRVLSFSFVGGKEATREPTSETTGLSVNGQVFPMLPGMLDRLAWYGLKQKLSDFEAGEKKDMTPAERLASLHECYAMLEGGEWSRAGARGVEAPATEDELAEAVIRIARVRKAKVTAEQAAAAATKLVGTNLPDHFKAMVRAIRAEARAEAKAGTAEGDGSFLAELFQS